MLFTDLVGSTEMLGRLGDDTAEQVRRAHFRLLRNAVASRGGEEVKNLGDGLMVIFPSAVDAIGCAVSMQQAVQRHNRDQDPGQHLAVRIGLNAGEPIRDEEDYFGTSVTVAKRLCDTADGGQVLVSDVVRSLVGTRGGHDFLALGALDLKGWLDRWRRSRSAGGRRRHPSGPCQRCWPRNTRPHSSAVMTPWPSSNAPGPTPPVATAAP